LARSEFVPIIEPVKEALTGLGRALTEVGNAGGSVAVIVNPFYGDHADDGDRIIDFLQSGPLDEVDISPAILLKEDRSIEDILRHIDRFDGAEMTLIHAGFSNGSALAAELGERVGGCTHVFLDDSSGRLYRRHFRGGNRVLLRDGFEKRRNRDHPNVEFYSDLHVTFEEEGMNGFGDFLTVGDVYSDSGGPAYAIAIHLTFIDPSEDNAMFVHHFLSERQDTPADPAGKFAEALTAMVQTLDRAGSPVFESSAVQEFRQLYEDRHFPGLGYAKKLSMQHHLETLAHHFEG
jgi:hypothetical protein